MILKICHIHYEYKLIVVRPWILPCFGNTEVFVTISLLRYRIRSLQHNTKVYKRKTHKGC